MIAIAIITDEAGALYSLTCIECCERNDLIEPVGCKDGTLPPKLMAEFLHPPGVDHPPRTLAEVHPIPFPQSSTSIFGANGCAAFYASDIAVVNDRFYSLARCTFIHVTLPPFRRGSAKGKLHPSCLLSNSTRVPPSG